eukprot:365192-Chlamydomonas_euryale.AAC.19
MQCMVHMHSSNTPHEHCRQRRPIGCMPPHQSNGCRYSFGARSGPRRSNSSSVRLRLAGRHVGHVAFGFTGGWMTQPYWYAAKPLTQSGSTRGTKRNQI